MEEIEKKPRRAYLSIHSHVDVKNKLEEVASAQNMSLPDFLRKHYVALGEVGLIETAESGSSLKDRTREIVKVFRGEKFVKHCEGALISLLASENARSKMTFMEAVCIKDLFQIGMQEVLKE